MKTDVSDHAADFYYFFFVIVFILLFFKIPFSQKRVGEKTKVRIL